MKCADPGIPVGYGRGFARAVSLLFVQRRSELLAPRGRDFDRFLTFEIECDQDRRALGSHFAGAGVDDLLPERKALMTDPVDACRDDDRVFHPNLSPVICAGRDMISPSDFHTGFMPSTRRKKSLLPRSK